MTRADTKFKYKRIPKWKHFDWAGLEHWTAEKKITQFEVVTLLRDPIQRAISHFNFIKTQSWVSGKALNSTWGA